MRDDFKSRKRRNVVIWTVTTGSSSFSSSRFRFFYPRRQFIFGENSVNPSTMRHFTENCISLLALLLNESMTVCIRASTRNKLKFQRKILWTFSLVRSRLISVCYFRTGPQQKITKLCFESSISPLHFSVFTSTRVYIKNLLRKKVMRETSKPRLQ